FRAFHFKYPTYSCISNLSLHDALPISVAPGGVKAMGSAFLISRGGAGSGALSAPGRWCRAPVGQVGYRRAGAFGERGELSSEVRSEEHTSELQSRLELLCRLLLE